MTVTKKAVTGLILEPDTVTLKVGETYDLQASVVPSDASNPKINWSSSKSSVASVDPTTGRITAKSAGEATITAQSADVTSIKKTCKAVFFIMTPMGIPHGGIKWNQGNVMFSVFVRKRKGQKSICVYYILSRT